MNLPPKSSLPPTLVVALAALLYFHAWSQAPVPTNDTPGYQAVAHDILTLHFAGPRLRPPGYPLLLLATGSADHLNRRTFAASLGLYFASVLLLYRLLMRCGTAAWLTWIFLLVALLPMYVETAAMAVTEVLTGFLLTLAVVQAVEGAVSGSPWRFLASGAALAYAGLTHPLFLTAFIPVLLAAALLRWPLRWTRIGARQTVRGVICLSSYPLLAFAALFLFNSLAYDYRGISPFAGMTLCAKTANFVERLPASYGEARTVMIKDRNDALINGKSHTAESYMWQARQSLMQVTGLDAVAVNALLLKMNWDLIKGSPLLYLNAVGHAIANFWMPRTFSFTHSQWLRLGCAVCSAVVILVWAMVFTLLGACAVLMLRGCYRSSRRQAPGLSGTRSFLTGAAFQVIANSMICWTCLISSAFSIGEIRFRAPVKLLLLALAAHGLQLLAKLLLNRPHGRAATTDYFTAQPRCPLPQSATVSQTSRRRVAMPNVLNLRTSVLHELKPPLPAPCSLLPFHFQLSISPIRVHPCSSVVE